MKFHIDQDKLFHFGCLVDYMPTPEWAKENIRKFGPSTVPGDFLGYQLPPGGEWPKFKGVYLCAPLSDFINGVKKPAVHAIQVVHPDLTSGSYQFLLKAKFDH